MHLCMQLYSQCDILTISLTNGQVIMEQKTSMKVMNTGATSKGDFNLS